MGGGVWVNLVCEGKYFESLQMVCKCGSISVHILRKSIEAHEGQQGGRAGMGAELEGHIGSGLTLPAAGFRSPLKV